MVHLRKRKGITQPPNREMYREFADALGAAIVIITADHEIRYMSEVAKKAWGSVEGKRCYRVFRNSRTVCAECPLGDVVADKGVEKRELRMQSLDGWHDYENLYVHVGDPSYPTQYVALVSTNIDERKHLQRKHLQSEQRFRNLFESGRDGIVYADMDGNILDANPAYLERLGYTIEELRALSNRQLTPEKWHQMESEVILEQVMPRGYSDEYEKENIRKDGSVIPVSVRVWLIKGEDGEPAGAWRIVRDITERKAAEEALRESEERYRLIANSSLAGIFVHDGTDLIYMNDSAVEISGYPKEHFKGMNDILDLLPGEERERVVDNIGKRMAGEDIPQVYDTKFVRANGDVAEVQLMNNFITIGGKPAILVMVNDVTERVEAEEAVRASEEKYRTLVESSKDAILIGDSNGDVLFANTAAARLAGTTTEGLIGRNLFAFIHPDERGETIKTIYREWSAGRDVDSYPIRVIVDGEEGFFEATMAILGEPGPDAQTMVIVRDVTEREDARRRLGESEERYRTIVENSRDGIAVSNRAGELLYANPAVEELFGYTMEELKGANLFKFVHPDERERVALAFMQDWKTGRTIPDYPIKLIKADGSHMHAELASGLVGWPDEDAIQIFVIRDVTERHHREEERALQLKIEEGITAITSRFIDPGDINKAIADTLEGAGELLGIDRVSYFEVSPDGLTMSNTLEWVAEGAESIREELQGLPTERGSWWLDILGSRRVIVMSDLEPVPGETAREFFQNKNIASVAGAPVFVADRLAGFIGFSDGTVDREWSVHEVELMKSMADTVSRALERREWVEELGRSERFRTRITENIAEGLMVLRNGVITWVNRRMLEIHGYESEEMIGRTTGFLIPGGDEYARSYAERMLPSFTVNGRYISEEKGLRKDGTQLDEMISVTSLGTEEEEEFVDLLVAVRDITESKRMQAEVEAAADAYSTLFSTAGDGLIVHTRDGWIRDVNERASLYTGYDRNALLGMNVIDLVAEGDRPFYGDRRKELETERPTVFETRLAKSGGGTLPVEITARMTRIWGETVVLASLRNIAQRKRAEDEVRRRAAQLSSLNDISKAATSSLDLDTVLMATLDVTFEVSGADTGLVILREPSGGRRTLMASRGLGREHTDRISDEGGESALMEVVAQPGRSIILDVDGEPGASFPGVREYLRGEGMAQVLCIPLKSGEKAIGVMFLASKGHEAFEGGDADFYDAVGAEIGVSVENALIYQELAAEHERLSILYRSAQSISGERELKALLETTAAEAARTAGADSALIALVDTDSGDFEWSAAFNLDIKRMEGVVVPAGSGGGGMAVKSKRAIQLPMKGQTSKDYGDDKVFGAFGMKSAAVVPLISGDRVVGVIGIHFDREGVRLSSEDVLLLEAMGRQAGVAIENAQLYEETRRHLEALEKAHDELMVLDRMKSDFVSTVSHELRSPLAVIEGFAKTLVEHFDRIDRETERESIEIILRKSIALEGLIENILDMSRIEEGRLEVIPEPQDLVEVCESVRADQDRVAEMHEVVLRAERAEIRVIADREKAEVALGNLVRNAVKFSPEGGTVTISVREAGEMAQVSVADEGIGIHPGEQERVFDRFYQVDSGETRSFQGSGLGLYITKELVEAMGGAIKVESEPGRARCSPLPCHWRASGHHFESRLQSRGIEVYSKGVNPTRAEAVTGFIAGRYAARVLRWRSSGPLNTPRISVSRSRAIPWRNSSSGPPSACFQ